MLRIDRKKRDTLEGHTEIEYRLEIEGKESEPTVRVIASKRGISIFGQVTDREELEKFAEMVGEGWQDFQNLRTKIVISGR